MSYFMFLSASFHRNSAEEVVVERQWSRWASWRSWLVMDLIYQLWLLIAFHILVQTPYNEGMDL